MNEHPIQVAVSDDLRRNRATVLFRLIMVIPHLIWALLWTIVVSVVLVPSWLITLVLGRLPGLLHRLLAAYVKYLTQLYAWFYLLAQPYPSFDGPDGYPVDLLIAPPRSQSRWRVLLRLPLAIPALLLSAPLLGASFGVVTTGSRGSTSLRSGLLSAVGLLGWFVSLAQGRMPRGLRDAGVYTVGYGAQLWAYLLLVTDRYPNSDPLAMLPESPPDPHPVGLCGQDELRRSRLTVFFRLPLAVPHLVWVTLWGLLAALVAIASWTATLVRGQSPVRLHAFLARYARYVLHVYAFLYLIANRFPGFAGAPGSFPLEAVISGPQRQNRAKTAFRLPLAFPGLLLSGAFGALLGVCAVLGWFASLVLGRMPLGIRNAGSLALRYQLQLWSYLLLLSDVYPYTGPTAERESHLGAPDPIAAAG